MGKEEIARNEQFLLFPQCFLLSQKTVSSFVNIFDIISLFTAELKEPKIGMRGKGLNLVGKGKTAGKSSGFSPFPIFFLGTLKLWILL